MSASAHNLEDIAEVVDSLIKPQVMLNMDFRWFGLQMLNMVNWTYQKPCE